VPSFDPDTTPAEDRAFRLAQNGAVTLFLRQDVLDETTGWLHDHGYRLVTLDARPWHTRADFHDDVRAALDFPDHYGANLDAFNDCMHEVATYAYGADRDATGTVLVFTGYDAFTAREPQAAQSILDIIAHAARHAMLVGHRLLCLVQSNDPDLGFDPVGATAVAWNPDERLWADRVRAVPPR